MLETFFGDDAEILNEAEFQLLLLATIAGPLGPALISPLMSSLTGPFSVSSTEIGLLLSAYTAPAIIGIPLAGVLTDRFGRKPVLVVGLAVFGLAGSAIAFTTDFTIVLLLRAIQGIGGAGIVPVIITSLGDLYSSSREATAQGLRFSMSGISLTVFPYLAGVLVAINWSYAFLLYLSAVPISILVLVFMREPRHLRTDSVATAVPESGIRQTLSLFTDRKIAAITIARGFPQFTYFGFLTYNSVIVVQGLGGAPTHSGLLVALSSGSMAVSASQAGRVTDVFGNRYQPLIGANLGLGGGLSFVALAINIEMAALGAALVGASMGVLLSLYRSIITGLVTTELRGSLVSITEAAGRVGSTLSPLVLGGLVALLTIRVDLLQAVRLSTAVAGVSAAIVSILCLKIYYTDAMDSAE